jgi:hypothetical protein
MIKRYFSTTNMGGLWVEGYKKPRLKNFEKREINLSKYLEEILIGLLLGGLCAQRRSSKGNVNLFFEQSIDDKDYILHLFELFKPYCRSEPKISDRIAEKRTSKIYTRILFTTYSLSCFNGLYNMFYPRGKKIVPWNIENMLTPNGLAYWICDNGFFYKRDKSIRITINSYTLQEVDLLMGVLRSKFNLNCYIVEDSNGYIIIIEPGSVGKLQFLLKGIMPSSMMHKIGL